MILKALPGIVSAFFLLAYSVVGLAADGGGENASNPLAKVKNTDLRWQYFDTGNGHINDVFVEGAFMANDNLKIKYELHYWETNVTGTSEQNLESTVLKAIYFPKEGQRGDRTRPRRRRQAGLGRAGSACRHARRRRWHRRR